MAEAEPVVIDARRAAERIAGLGRLMVLHAGPPLAWTEMCGPLRGAIAGAILYEGWAPDLATAEALAAGGRIAFHPNHHFDAVGPMTGMTTASMELMVVENRRFGNRAYCALNEGLGKGMPFGANGPEVIERLRWLASALAPALGAALREQDGLKLRPI